jgi:hypothetical protein
MLIRLFTVLLVFAASTGFCQSTPNVAGIWNGSACTGMGDMIVSGSSTPVPTAGFIHIDVDVTTYDEAGKRSNRTSSGPEGRLR